MRALLSPGARRLACFSTISMKDLSKKYPFPQSSNPTPYEIFHLTAGADQHAVKRRYFELVRIHHPDLASARGIPVEVAERRFKAITAAYARLRNPHRLEHHHPRDHAYHEEIRRRKAAYYAANSREAEFRRQTVKAEPVGLWQRDEGLLFIFVLLGFFAAFYQFASPTPSHVVHRRHTESQKYLSEARARGKADGMRRREEIKAWLRDRRTDQPSSPESDPSSSKTRTTSGDLAGFGDAVPLMPTPRVRAAYQRE